MGFFYKNFVKNLKYMGEIDVENCVFVVMVIVIDILMLLWSYFRRVID